MNPCTTPCHAAKSCTATSLRYMNLLHAELLCIRPSIPLIRDSAHPCLPMIAPCPPPTQGACQDSSLSDNVTPNLQTPGRQGLAAAQSSLHGPGHIWQEYTYPRGSRNCRHHIASASPDCHRPTESCQSPRLSHTSILTLNPASHVVIHRGH